MKRMISKSVRWLAGYSRLMVPFLALTLGSVDASAQEYDGWYAGVGVGSSHIEVYRHGWFGLGYWEEGPGDGTALLLGGYRFGELLAIEAAYLSESELEWRETNAFDAGLAGVSESTTVLSNSALQLSVLGILPFANIWDVYLRGGVSWYRADTEQRVTDGSGGPPLVRLDNASNSGLLLGFGIRAAPRENWRIRLEYQFYSIDRSLLNIDGGDDPSVDAWLFGIDFGFGGSATP